MEKPKCPKCESHNILFRIRVKSFICRICGHVWKKKSEKIEK